MIRPAATPVTGFSLATHESTGHAEIQRTGKTSRLNWLHPTVTPSLPRELEACVDVTWRVRERPPEIRYLLRRTSSENYTLHTTHSWLLTLAGKCFHLQVILHHLGGERREGGKGNGIFPSWRSPGRNTMTSVSYHNVSSLTLHSINTN